MPRRRARPPGYQAGGDVVDLKSGQSVDLMTGQSAYPKEPGNIIAADPCCSSTQDF
jgi:hypothetical protein